MTTPSTPTESSSIELDLPSLHEILAKHAGNTPEAIRAAEFVAPFVAAALGIVDNK